jgi:hypothetical protein
MTRKQKAKPTTRQSKTTVARKRDADDFVSVARRIGADEDKATFEAKLGKIARAKPTSA